ncbi:MAG: 2OG-Fe(II) oxygenase, partial [Proteobacteria bacterium]|nr:2OG-Fe(II) oxygenase [Pseudomonadota bacterium]
MPEKLIYPLEHVYTAAEIGFETLKNADAAVGALLVKAAQKAQCDLSLALVNIEETGSAEEIYYGRRHHYHRDSETEAFEMGEVFERRLVLTGLRAADDSRAVLQRLPFVED